MIRTDKMEESMKLIFVERKDIRFIKYIFYASIISFLFLIPLIFIQERLNINWIYLQIPAGILIGSNIFLVILGAVRKNYKIIGKAIFHYDCLKIILEKNEKSLSFSEIDSLEIEINETASDLAGRMSSKTGIENYIKINVANQTSEYMFYLENRVQFDYMIRFLRNIKLNIMNKSVSITEKNMKTYFTLH